MPTSRTSSSTSPEVTASLDAIRRLLRALRLAAQETQARAGVSAAQLFVLRTLEDGESASVSQLAERTMTDRSSVASVVERLALAKMISRSTAASDRRRAAIAITAKGRAAVRKAPVAPTMLLLNAMELMPQKDLRTLSAGLTALVGAMGIDKGPAGMLFEDKAAKSGKRAPR